MLVHRIRHAEHGIPAKQDVDAAAAATGSAGSKGSADYAGEDIFDQEDVFSECLPSLFPDETFTFVGNPGEVLEYASPLFGSVIVHLPGHGNGVSGDSHSTADEHSHATQENTGESVNTQGLFAHLLWGAALIVSDEIEKTAAKLRSQAASHEPLSLERQLWRVQGEDVLELGAGSALPSLIALLCGANSMAITDHPSAGGIHGPNQRSMAAVSSSSTETQSLSQRTDIQSHKWGDLPRSSTSEPSEDSRSSSQVFALKRKASFSRIICVDCLWMSDQHDNLAKSIAWFLRKPSSTTDPAAGGIAYVVAGFHTGRHVVARFFEEAIPRNGLRVEGIYERDLNAPNEATVTREWQPSRCGETDLPRWNVVAFVRRQE